MSKRYYCAKCGMKLEVVQKANPKEGTVLNLVIPHKCEESLIEDEPTKDLDRASPIGDNTSKILKDLDKEAESPEILDKENEKKLDKTVDKLFNDFPFVKKLNKATAEHEVVTQETGDKRDRKHLREELVTSSAPLNILDTAAKSNVKPAHDLEEKSNGK